MIAAQLDENNNVINRIVVDSLDDFPNLVADGPGAAIGGTYNPQNGTFTPPPEVIVIPEIVTKAGGKIAMDRAGVLTAVELDMTTRGGEALVWWQETAFIRRDFPLVETVRVSQGWTVDYVDQLFIAAEQIDSGG